MKKILIWAIVLVVLVVLLFPMNIWHAKDGGSILYDALLYDFEKVHAMWDVSLEGHGTYLVGYRLTILGIEIFDNTRLEYELIAYE